MSWWAREWQTLVQSTEADEEGVAARQHGGDTKQQRAHERQIFAEQRLQKREREGKANREELTQLIDPKVGGLHNPEDGKKKVRFRVPLEDQISYRVPASQLDNWSRFTRSLKPRMTVKYRLSVWRFGRLEIWTDFTLRLIEVMQKLQDRLKDVIEMQQRQKCLIDLLRIDNARRHAIITEFQPQEKSVLLLSERQTCTDCGYDVFPGLDKCVQCAGADYCAYHAIDHIDVKLIIATKRYEH